jgi:hypothetical protein
MSPSKSKKVTLPLATAVRTEDGVRSVNRGDPLPDNTLPEEKKRLEEAGVLGTKKQATALANLSAPLNREVETTPPVDAAQALVDSEARELARTEAAAKQAADEASHEQTEEEREIAKAQAEQAKAAGESGSSGSSASSAPVPTADSSDEDLDAFTANATVDEVLDAATSPELAQRLYESEDSVRKDKARKSLGEGLVERGATGDSRE